MFQGAGMWRTFPREMRIAAINDALSSIPRQARLFGVVVEKAVLTTVNPVEYAFEQLCNRFDRFLHRRFLRHDVQRGIIIFDKTSYETTLQGLTANFRTLGHRWGVVRNLAEVPLFIDSRASRLVQLADLISYALYRKYEAGDDRFLAPIQRRFDGEALAVHGLHVLQSRPTRTE